MSQADVAMPSAAPCIVSIPMHAYIPDLDSEERALQARQMAPLSSAGYQQIPQSDQPPGAHGARSAASDRPRLDADNEETQQAVPVGTARSRIWRTFLTSSSNNPFSTSIPKRKEEADQDDSKYERLEDFEDGIPQLSRLMDSDKNFFVVRLFGPYAARILLQRELQLNTLIKRLCKLDREDAADITRQYRLCTTTFSEQGDPAQTELLREIEVKLGEYYDFLLKYMEVKALGKPTKRDQRSIQRWISDHAPLVDEESDFILYFDDLVTAKSHLNSTAPSNTIEDTIESYMANNPNSHLTRLLHKFIILESKIKTNDPNVVHYSFESLSTLARNIQALLAVAFLLIPVFLLFLVPMSRASMAGTVLSFVFAFSCALAILSKPKPQEMLIGTAA